MDGPKKDPSLDDLVREKMARDAASEPRPHLSLRSPSTAAVFCIGIILTLATGALISAVFHIESGPEERFEFIGLVILVFMLFHPRSRKTALIIFTILAGLVFIGGTSMIISHREATKYYPTYQIGHFADDADEPAIDFHEQLAQRPDSVRFIIKNVPEGAWSRVYKLPDKLRNGMCVEPYPAEDIKAPDMYMAFNFVKPDGSSYKVTGPLVPGSNFYIEFDRNFPMAFRIQGHIPHGIAFRVSTVAPNGKCVG